MTDSTHPQTFSPQHALCTPAWGIALGTLVLNDHVLKAAFPGVVTGKISDLAGLFLIPALLAVLCRLRSTRQVGIMAALVGSVFALINLSAEGAAAFDACMSVIFTFHTTTDPGDLLMLPALITGVLHTHAHGHRVLTKPRTQTARVLVLAGSLACLGSGSPPEPEPAEGALQYQGSVTVLNKSNELHVLTIRALSGNTLFDCQEIAQNPAAFITNELFNNPQTTIYTVPLFSGEEIAINPGEWSQNWNASGASDCPVLLVESNALPDIVVFYQTRFMEFKAYYHNADIPEQLTAAEQTIVIEADYSGVQDMTSLHTWREITCPLTSSTDSFSWNFETEWEQCFALDDAQTQEAARVPQGTRYSWRSVNQNVPLFFERSSIEQGSPISMPARCRVPGPGEGLVWENTLPQGYVVITDIERGLDGCHTLRFEQEQSWVFCGPIEPFERLLDVPNVSVFLSDSFTPQSDLSIDVEGHPSIRKIALFRGQYLDAFYNLQWKQEVRDGCAPTSETCGEVSLPVDLRITSQNNQLLIPGEFITLNFGQFHLVRASYRPLINLDCDERVDENIFNFDISRPFIEAVIVSEL